jgi:Domain of unknown function (DUF4386)
MPNGLPSHSCPGAADRAPQPCGSCAQPNPRSALLGVWRGLAGIAWVMLSLTGILLPQYQEKADTYSQPAFIGEIVFMLWLLIKGARPPGRDAGASSAAAG